MEHVTVQRRAQDLGAGEHADERHLCCRRDGKMRRAGRRTDIAEQREHLVLLDQPLARRRGERGLIAIVLGDEVDPATMDATGGIDVVQVRLDAVAHLDAELRRRAAEDRRLAEENPVRRDSRISPGARRCKRQRRA